MCALFIQPGNPVDSTHVTPVAPVVHSGMVRGPEVLIVSVTHSASAVIPLQPVAWEGDVFTVVEYNTAHML